MTWIRYHDDPPCQADLDAEGRCPACGFIPDMQSLGLRRDEPHSVLHDMAQAMGWPQESVITADVTSDPDWLEKLEAALKRPKKP